MKPPGRSTGNGITLKYHLNNTSNSSIFHTFFFVIVNLALKLIFNPLLPHFSKKKKKKKKIQLFQKKSRSRDLVHVTYKR